MRYPEWNSNPIWLHEGHTIPWQYGRRPDTFSILQQKKLHALNMAKYSIRRQFDMKHVLFNREEYTLQLLKKFKAKVDIIKTKKQNEEDDSDGGPSKAVVNVVKEVNEEELNTDKWMVRPKYEMC